MKIGIIEDQQSHYDRLKKLIIKYDNNNFEIVDIGITTAKEYPDYINIIKNLEIKPDIYFVDYELAWGNASSPFNGKQTIEDILNRYYKNSIQPFIIYISGPFIDVALKISRDNALANKRNITAVDKSELTDQYLDSSKTYIEELLTRAEIYLERFEKIKVIKFYQYPTYFEGTHDLFTRTPGTQPIDINKIPITPQNFVGLILTTDNIFRRHCLILFEKGIFIRVLLELGRMDKPTIKEYLGALGLDYMTKRQFMYNPNYISNVGTQFLFKNSELHLKFYKIVKLEIKDYKAEVKKFPKLEIKHPYKTIYESILKIS
jgi:hypothetical protein